MRVSQAQCVRVESPALSLASHTLCREEGSGHAATTELSPRNAIIEPSG